MEERVTRWKRPPQSEYREPNVEAMARLIAGRLRQAFGKEILQGPFLDQILSKAREMIADQVEESVGAAMFEPDLVVVEEEEESSPSNPLPQDTHLSGSAHFPDFAEVARRIRERKKG